MLIHGSPATNFVAIDVGWGEWARALLQELALNSVFIRMPRAPVLDRYIRVTVGAQEHQVIFTERLKAALEAVPE